MLAWTIARDAIGGLALQEVAEPVAMPHEAMVQVRAFAPNPGDIAALATGTAGAVPGWDGAGVVVRPAADGSGPEAGAHVAFLGASPGGWAQKRVVPTAVLAVAPAGTPVAQLAALPVPATSALRALRRLGSIFGKRVLITGATSAVGRIAVQLAARSGAHVVAIARDPLRHDELRGLGTAEVHADLSTVDAAVHEAIDIVGGSVLVGSYGLLRAGGTVIALGHAAQADETFSYGAFVAGPDTANRSITTFFLGSEPELAEEMALLAGDSALDLGRVVERPWTELSEWVAAGAPRTSARMVFVVDDAGSA